jgi:phosphatidylethanolamine-binding protein (PEBP) family uncharacterized protein
MRISPTHATVLALVFGAGLLACGNEEGGGTGGTGGSAGSGGSTGGAGGRGTGGSSAGSGGSSAGSGGSTGGSGGSTGGSGAGTGGSGGSGGATGGSGGSTGGSGGSTGGSGGSTGGSGGGTADMGPEGGGSDMAGDSAGTGAFTITGDFSMMGTNKCFKSGNTRNTGQRSPAIMWTSPPEGTMSFAVSLRDLQGGIHWVMYNIPPTATGLAAAIPAGAMPGSPAPMGSSQSETWYGPGAGEVHRYEYQVWALKVPTVNGSKANLYNTVLPMQRISSAKVHACGNAGASCAGCPAGPQ